MPTHGGIKLSIFSQVEQTDHPELPRLHPEFPHPESSQFTFRSPDLRHSRSAIDWSPPSPSSDSKADRLLGRQSIVAVYIPSVPGARFWVQYSIAEAAATHSQWYFFKLCMNGRQITSWGTNARTHPTGQIMKGLFEPSDYWNYEYEGVMYKNMGLEQRSFFFGFESETRSAASDGGLIEVMVFRARGRKRQMPNPPDFKSQKDYGIMMLSEALVDKPQDAKFYDWHLKDPKDQPFSVFKFHYRSWESLESLQLIPSNHSRVLLPPSASLLSLAGFPREDQVRPGEEKCPEDSESPSKVSEASEISVTPWLTTVFDDSPQSTKNRDKREAFVVPPETLATCSLRSPSIPTSKFSAAVVDKPPSPKSSPTSSNLNRPLPQIPRRKSSLRHQRNASSASHAPSIAPSLLEYVDRDTASPEPEICVAEAVDVALSSPIVAYTEKILDTASDDEQYADEHSTHSPLFGSVFKRQDIASPVLTDCFSMPNVTIRKRQRWNIKSLQVTETTPKFGNKYKENEVTPTIDNMTTLSLTESEWICRTPSPVKNDNEHNRYSELWSPGPGRKCSREGGVSQKIVSEWSEQVIAIPEEPSDIPTRDEFENEEKIRSGNWI